MPSQLYLGSADADSNLLAKASC